jgi:hypothetical protein
VAAMTESAAKKESTLIAEVETGLSESLAQNTTLTNQLKDLAAQNLQLTKTVENLSREIHAVVCAAAAKEG